MKVTYDRQQSQTIKGTIINEVERRGHCEKDESFFKMEEKLLNHLFRSEKEEAQKIVKIILDSLIIRTENKNFDVIKYYLITLSSLVARHLEKKTHIPQEAFDFNVDCFVLIDSKLNEKNSVEFIDDLIEFYTHILSETKQPQLIHGTVNDVIDFVNKNVESAMTVEGIAKIVNSSTSHLSRIFREHTGITLVEYIAIRKVEESQYHLRFSEDKISDISDRFHFCNQSYFTRIFKKYTGQTPRRFRSSLAGEYFHYTLHGEEKKFLSGQSL